MNRIDRLSAIIIMLQSRKLITAKEISERFDIGLRTVYRDMKALSESGVPIGAEAGRGYYLVEGYHLPPVTFTPEEAGALLVSGKLVDEFSDHSVQLLHALAMDKIRSVLPEQHLQFIGEMNNNVHVFNDSLGSDQNLSKAYLMAVQLAISEGKCLVVEYLTNMHNQHSERIIEPLSLCFYGFKWHLIAFCRLRNDYRDFRLDRIQGLSMCEFELIKARAFSIEDYFKRRLSNENLLYARVRFKKAEVDKIRNIRYYFGFFEERVDVEYIEMKFAVNSYDYLASWLLGLGGMVLKIIQPELREIIQQNIKDLNKLYNT